MWYEISSEDMYLLQEALAALRTAKYNEVKNMPCFRENIMKDIKNISRLSEYLYDGGRQIL
jgi:hypothetical protein